jgi:cathepsin B
MITKEHLDELRQVADFEVLSFEEHPFANWSEHDVKHKLGLMLDPNFGEEEVFYGEEIEDLPESFDGRQQWPDCIHPIRDQKSCGSCWAFAAAGVHSDRICISTGGKTNVVLSPQDMVSCDKNNFGCQGGYVDKSWDYIRDKGVVTEECHPYVSGDGNSRTGDCVTSACKSKSNVETKRHQVHTHGRHTTIQLAKQTLSTEGPVEAAFYVYKDFMSYAGGVYKRKSSQFMGGHAVRVIGYGKEAGTEYWIVANSWGPAWGEKGHFRIAFGECNFESQLWSGKPKITHEHHHFLN